MANVEVPRSATIERQFTGTYNKDTITVTLYKGSASDGYKSDFTKRPARWIVWSRKTSTGKRIRRQASRFGGRRYPLAITEFMNNISDLQNKGVQLSEITSVNS